jgi:putative GTP pyrophosphokinase
MALDEYRRSFGTAYESVVRTIREQTQLEPTGRPAKSTGSLIEKLHRESIRLTQVQDIAGCRVIVTDITNQDRVVALLRAVFPGVTVVDRREHSSYGYRAVHVIVNVSGSLVEIQIRTSLQHLWAELSEKLSDVVDSAIKYGGGPPNIRDLLTYGSTAIADVEKAEALKGIAQEKLANAKQIVEKFADMLRSTPEEEVREAERDPEYIQDKEHMDTSMREIEEHISELEIRVDDFKRRVVNVLNELISVAHRFKGTIK